MKSILIAAIIAGAAGAGLIVYMRNRSDNAGTKRIKDAASDAYNTMNAGIGKTERLGQHAMG